MDKMCDRKIVYDKTELCDENGNLVNNNSNNPARISQIKNLQLEENRSYATCLELIDILISSFVIGPSVIAFWRGTWSYANSFLFPINFLYSGFASLAIGIVGHMFFIVFQTFVHKRLNPDKHRLIYYLGSRLYSYIFGIVCVNMWRGIWAIVDILTGLNNQVILVITFIAIYLLVLMKTSRNIASVPFFIVIDKYEQYFRIKTMFKRSGNHEPGLYVLDCLFSVLGIGTLVIIVWRGAWIALDLLLYPENLILSSWVSVGIGYGIVAVTFALQPIMRSACDRLMGFWRIALADIFLFISFIGTINVWRGIWNLIDIYFLPENPLLSYGLTHGISFILLALLNCSNSVLVRGVYVDAEEPAGQCVVFPIHYVRLFFQKERSKKQRRLLEALERQDQNHMFLLDKSQINNVKIVKSNGGIMGGPELKPMLDLQNEKTLSVSESNQSLKE